MDVHLLHHAADTRTRLSAHLRDAGLTVQAFDCAEDLISCLDTNFGGVIVTDLCLPGLHEGMELLAQCHAMDPHLPVVVLGERNDAATAVEAIRKGAYDFFTDDRLPLLAQVCRTALRSRELALQARRIDCDEAEDEPFTAGGRPPIQRVLRGNHPAVIKLRQSLLRLAHIDTDVLIRAETGCGKEVVARCLHDYGTRSQKPFVAINCGAIPEHIFESEVFGHEAGAFTGAQKRRIGKLEYASGGTVFLDEIESLPMAMQVKLLRALQQRTIERVGGNEAIKLNCRVVAATKDDLLALARQQRFRMDLYYRLNVVELGLPPLRERREDIPMLAHTFAHEAAEHHGLPDAELDLEFVCRLMGRDWPGNVRELRNAVERRVLGMPELSNGGEPLPKTLAEQVASFERAVIEQSLRMCRGSVTRVSEALCVPRKTLYDKLTRFSVEPAQFRGHDAQSRANGVSYAPAAALH
jgi:DNA-binding NtrC family response regulator